MDIKILSGKITEVKSDCVLLGIYEGVKKLAGELADIDRIMGGIISDLITRQEIKGKLYEIHFIHTLGKMPARVIQVIGLGKQEEFGADKLRNAVGHACRSVENMNFQSITVVVDPSYARSIQLAESMQAITEGAILGLYSFRKYFTKASDTRHVKQLFIISNEKNNLNKMAQACQRGKISAEAANTARDMVNEPANYMRPNDLVAVAKKIAKKHMLAINVLERSDMEKASMGAFLGVAQGSLQPPKFITVEYKGNPQSKEKVAFIGKGITFDSGGINLKTTENIKDMKGDMSGAAAVLAAINAIAQLKLKLNLVAIVAATENMPSSSALKPGDVVKAMNGKTIEVANTDAEGRLTLADALNYAVKNKCTELIDIATLTGSCQVALGDVCSGVFTNNQNLADKIIKAADKADECLWQFPMREEYREQNKSEIADIKNTGGRFGGAITAAMFLEEFAGKIPWIHIDIAGTFMLEKERGYLAKGATGVMVRTLINYAELSELSKGRRY